MTTQEMITELSRSLGNRTDIDNARYVLFLNMAINEIATMWKARAIPAVRFHCLEANRIFSTIVIENTITTAALRSVGLNVAELEQDGYYDNWIIELTDYDTVGAGAEAPSGLLGQKRIMYSYLNATNTALISAPWDTIPDAYTTYTLYKKEYSLLGDVGINPISQLVAIQKVEKLSNGTKLEMREWGEFVGSGFDSIGESSQFSIRGESIVLAPAPSEQQAYRVYYYRYPTQLSAMVLAAECELPLDWHELVILGAVYRGFEKLMEPDRALEAKEAFINALNRQSYSTFEDMEISKSFTVRTE